MHNLKLPNIQIVLLPTVIGFKMPWTTAAAMKLYTNCQLDFAA